MDKNILRKKIANKLTSKYEEREAVNIAKYLLVDLLGNDEDIVTLAQEEEINAALKRIINDEPLQYVTGRADFYGYQFKVDDTVLIPRPETEELVYQILNYLKKSKFESPKILDIGTGSGCIPITIKKEYPSAQIVAVDISAAGLDLASQNADSSDVDIDFQLLDVLSDSDMEGLGKFDLIVSNPPYIPYSESDQMGKSVILHEPHIALFTDDDKGLKFYSRIADLSSSMLNKGGSIFLELNEYHANEIANLYLKLATAKSVDIIKDMQGKSRILKVQY